MNGKNEIAMLETRVYKLPECIILPTPEGKDVYYFFIHCREERNWRIGKVEDPRSWCNLKNNQNRSLGKEKHLKHNRRLTTVSLIKRSTVKAAYEEVSEG